METLKPIIELITCESGDWAVLRSKQLNFEYQGHSIPYHEWIKLLILLGYKVEEQEITDKDMEENFC